jgi:hypothetical protein
MSETERAFIQRAAAAASNNEEERAREREREREGEGERGGGRGSLFPDANLMEVMKEVRTSLPSIVNVIIADDIRFIIFTTIIWITMQMTTL